MIWSLILFVWSILLFIAIGGVFFYLAYFELYIDKYISYGISGVSISLALISFLIMIIYIIYSLRKPKKKEKIVSSGNKPIQQYTDDQMITPNYDTIVQDIRPEIDLRRLVSSKIVVSPIIGNRIYTESGVESYVHVRKLPDGIIIVDNHVIYVPEIDLFKNNNNIKDITNLTGASIQVTKSTEEYDIIIYVNRTIKVIRKGEDPWKIVITPDGYIYQLSGNYDGGHAKVKIESNGDRIFMDGRRIKLKDGSFDDSKRQIRRSGKKIGKEVCINWSKVSTFYEAFFEEGSYYNLNRDYKLTEINDRFYIAHPRSSNDKPNLLYRFNVNVISEDQKESYNITTFQKFLSDLKSITFTKENLEYNVIIPFAKLGTKSDGRRFSHINFSVYEVRNGYAYMNIFESHPSDGLQMKRAIESDLELFSPGIVPNQVFCGIQYGAGTCSNHTYKFVHDYLEERLDARELANRICNSSEETILRDSVSGNITNLRFYMSPRFKYKKYFLDDYDVREFLKINLG